MNRSGQCANNHFTILIIVKMVKCDIPHAVLPGPVRAGTFPAVTSFSANSVFRVAQTAAISYHTPLCGTSSAISCCHNECIGNLSDRRG